MNKLITGLLTLGLFFASPLSSQSLQETLDLALKNNPDIKSRQSELQKTELQAKAAFRSTLPQLSFNASYRHVTDVAEINFPAIGGGLVPASSIQLGVYDTYESGLNLNYVLFSGFAQRNRVRVKNNQSDLSRSGLNKIRKQIGMQTINGYRAVQGAMLELQSLEAGYKRSLSQLRRAKSLQEQGMALALDTLALSLSCLGYQQKIIAAQSKLETAEQQLENLAGRKIEVSIFNGAYVKSSVPELQAKNSDDLQGLSIQSSVLKNMLNIKKASYLPAVSLQAAYKYGKPGLDMIKNEWTAYGLWGIQLSWNLFRWNADKLEVQAAQADLTKISFQRQKAEDRLRFTYEKAVRELHSLQEQLKVMDRALKVARQKMEITHAQYEQGVRTADDYADSNLEFTQAEINYKQHILRLKLKMNEIEFISGKPISEWSVE